MYSVFPVESRSRLRKGHLKYVSTFDVKTSDYIDGYILFNVDLKDIVTIDKVYQIEKKLRKAHLNAGPQNFAKPDNDYFVI